MTTRFVSFLVIWLATWSMVAAQERQTQLSDDGVTSFAVVISEKPNVEASTAALWLSETLEQVTGAKFPIRKETDTDLPQTVLRVAANSRMKPEEWHIKTSPNQVLLEGGMPRGAIYAVCEFLETHVGVLRLDPFTEHVPKQPTLTIPAMDRTIGNTTGLCCTTPATGNFPTRKICTTPPNSAS